jgi:hypothetical protein
MTDFSVVVSGTAVPSGVVSPEITQPDVLVVPEGLDEAEAARCGETTASGEPCKNTPGDDGLCGVHRRKAAADGTDEPDDEAEDAEPEHGKHEGADEDAPVVTGSRNPITGNFE